MFCLFVIINGMTIFVVALGIPSSSRSFHSHSFRKQGDDRHINKYTNTQIHKHTNTQIHKYTNTQTYKYKVDISNYSYRLNRQRG